MSTVLHNTVQKLRLDAGLTQEELARELGVTRQTVIAIEKGNYVPSLSLAMALAQRFRQPVEKIFYYE